MGEYKDKLLKEFNSGGFKVGERVKVPRKHFTCFYVDTEKAADCEVVEAVSKSVYKVKLLESPHNLRSNRTERALVEAKDIKKDEFMVGHNPFKNIGFWGKCEKLNFDMEGILILCGISNVDDEFGKESRYTVGGYDVPEMNYDPFIIDKDGNKVHYQRDYVWTVEDERQFIDSIYNGVPCGTIVIRKRPWEYVEDMVKKGETDSVAFNDVVDGKQRIHTLERFVNDKFTDSYGFYYSDLSKKAKVQFKHSNSLNLLRLNEKSTDEDVVKSFVMINHAGKPMPKEHLDFVRNIKV